MILHLIIAYLLAGIVCGSLLWAWMCRFGARVALCGTLSSCAWRLVLLILLWPLAWVGFALVSAVMWVFEDATGAES